MATSLAALDGEDRDVLIALLDASPGPVSERELAESLRRHHRGALTRAPAELIERLADHFVRVVAWGHPGAPELARSRHRSRRGFARAGARSSPPVACPGSNSRCGSQAARPAHAGCRLSRPTRRAGVNAPSSRRSARWRSTPWP